MAGGPLYPSSAFPVTAGRVMGGFHVGAGANSKRDGGLQFIASLDTDATWELRFPMPPVIPSGTCKLRAKALAAAVSGAAKLNPKIALVGHGEDPSSAALSAEGTQTLTWAAGDSDDYKEFVVPLGAVTIDSGAAGKTLVMNLVGETVLWTLAVVLTLAEVRLVWED